MSTHNICFSGEIRKISALIEKKKKKCLIWGYELDDYGKCPKLLNTSFRSILRVNFV